MKQILVMGGTGFIGKRVCLEIKNRGWLPIVAGRSDSADIIIDTSNIESTTNSLRNIEIQGAINLMGKIDSSAGPFKYSQFIEEQLLHTAKFVESLWELHQVALVHVGSNAEYGNCPIPQTPYSLCIPTSAYGYIKHASTIFIQAKAQAENRCAQIVRPFFVYGPGAPESNFIEFIAYSASIKKTIKTSPGYQTRDMIHVDRVAKQIVDALDRATPKAEIENACTGYSRTLRSVIEVAVGHTQKEFNPEIGAIPYRPGDLMESEGEPFIKVQNEIAKAELELYLKSRIDEFTKERRK